MKLLTSFYQQEKFNPENHFRKPGFKHGARGPFTKSKKKKKKN